MDRLTIALILIGCFTVCGCLVAFILAGRELKRAQFDGQFVAWLQACAPNPEHHDSDFSQGVIRGFEIIIAQVANGHHWKHISAAKGIVEDSSDERGCGDETGWARRQADRAGGAAHPSLQGQSRPVGAHPSRGEG